jgi:spermidine synthase
MTRKNHWLYLIFFASGFSALVYQLVWQRALFTIYGVNIESITIVVTAFMLGLGFGSLLGGQLSRLRWINPLVTFGLMELGIAVYGFYSLTVFEWVGLGTAGSPATKVFLITFSLVLMPTLFMGATLPLLTSHIVPKMKNVGQTVANLYFVNSLGSATACFLAALWLFASFGMRGTTSIAVFVNGVIGLSVFLMWLLSRQSDSNTEKPTVSQPDTATDSPVIPMRLAVSISCVIGFLSLSYEIVWARIMAFTTMGWALAFPLLLGAFLLGIALGSLIARHFCRTTRDDVAGTSPIVALAWFLFLASLVSFAAVPVLSRLITLSMYFLPVFLVFVTAGAALMGATFPIIAHFSISPNATAGSKVSWLYMANILGAAVGASLTGLVLMDWVPMRGILVFLSGFGLFLSASLVFALHSSRRKQGILAVLGSLILVVVVAPLATDRLYERLMEKADFSGEDFAHVVENKSGVIVVDRFGAVFGSGAYDGKFSVDLVNDTNAIYRPYALNAFHSNPRDVLFIGLSSGSWVQVVANNPDVERIEVIEINPGYLELVAGSGVNASILEKQKVNISIDDGRRWLYAHPDSRFDAILINATYNWRAYASNLLSREFLGLAKKHLKTGGILMYNGTCADEVYRTAALEFPHMYRFSSLAVVSNEDITPDRSRWARTLENYTIDGEPVFDLTNTAHKNRYEILVGLFDQPISNRTTGYTEDECFASINNFETKSSVLGRTEGVSENYFLGRSKIHNFWNQAEFNVTEGSSPNRSR